MRDWHTVVAEAIGTIIRVKREELGLSRTELALRLDSYRPIVGEVEKGRRGVPSLDQVNAYARALRCSPLELLAPLDLRREAA